MRHQTTSRVGTPPRLTRIAAAIGIVLAVLLASCADDATDGTTATNASPESPSPEPETVTTPTTLHHEPSPSTAPAAAGSDDDAAAVLNTLQSLQRAETAGDAAAFVALWTDPGLEQYGLGSRAEILANGFGEERGGEMLGEPAVTITGDDASAAVDMTAGIGKYRITFALIREPEGWLIDGFGFAAAPPADGVPVVEVRAVDYAYGFDRSALASGTFALHFDNTGTQEHEIALFRIPDDATVAEASTALADVDPSTYEGVPDGYRAVDHVSFAMPGETMDFTLASPLEAGHYVFVCFIPEGGMANVDSPGVKPHVALGMIADFTVE